MADERALPAKDESFEAATHSAAQKTTDRLCQACRNIFVNPLKHVPTAEHTQNQPHHATAHDCQRSADAGCPVCVIVWRRGTANGTIDVFPLKLESAFSQYTVSTNKTGHYSHKHWPPETLVLTISTGSVSYARGLGPLHVFANDGVDFALLDVAERKEDVYHTVRSSRTDSDETWDRIHRWLDVCVAEHKCTSREVKAGKVNSEHLPSRVLDVGVAGDDYVRLINKKEGKSFRPYVALSHCWGARPNLVLIDEKLPHSREGRWIPLGREHIPMSLLPRTYREAVDATRRLNVRYLWIDSLNIVQNSEEDWKRESENMRSIYGLAYCTIAADGSPDSEGGLFHDRSVALVDPLIVTPRWEEADIVGSYSVIYSNFWKEKVSESVLGVRGWTVQERYLSPAVIHFGKDQVLWECRCQDCCETFPTGLPLYAADMVARFKGWSAQDARLLRTTYADPERQDDEAGDESLDMYYLWSRMVEKYTRTAVSYDKDKLIAIYGLGSFFEYLLRDSMAADTGKYVAGLWMDILPSQLLWSVENHHTVAVFNADGKSRNSSKPLARRPSGARAAPSWSWASVIGPIVMPKPLRKGAMIEVMLDSPVPPGDITDRPSFDRVFGFHQSIMLHVTGRLHIGSLRFLSDWDRWVLAMQPLGFGSQQPGAKAQHSGSAGQGPHGEGSSGVRSMFSRMKLDSKVKPDKQPASKSALHLLMDRDNFALKEDVVHGLVQMDTERDVQFPPFVPKHGPMPTFCLPVIDTRKCGKKALRHDVGFQLSGVSGLILIPPDPNFPGFYQRVGVFDLVGDAEQKLGYSTADFQKYENLFLPGSPGSIKIV